MERPVELGEAVSTNGYNATFYFNSKWLNNSAKQMVAANQVTMIQYIYMYGRSSSNVPIGPWYSTICVWLLAYYQTCTWSPLGYSHNPCLRCPFYPACDTNVPISAGHCVFALSLACSRTNIFSLMFCSLDDRV